MKTDYQDTTTLRTFGCSAMIYRMRSVAAAILTLSLWGCNEQVDESYSTYSDAQRAGAVERGWIPSFVPSSARDLKDTHNLDTSRQTLRFTIPPSVAAEMVSGLRALSTEDKTAASELVVREQCVFAVRDEVIFAGLHGCRLRPLQVVIGTRCAIV